MEILASLAGIGSLVCWIITLISMFKQDKVLLGVLGILCPLWALIWGWMNLEKTGQKKVMLIWSVCVIISTVAGTTIK